MPRYRRSDFGSIDKTPAGSWRIRWYEDTKDGRRRRCETVRGMRRDAAKRLAEIQLNSREAPERTLGYYADRYYWPGTEKLRANTIRSYRDAWKSIEGVFGDMPVSAITPNMINDELQKLSANAASIWLRVLRSVMECARIYGTLTDNPADRKFKIPERRVEYSKGIYTREQLDGLWGIYRGWDIEPAFLLQSYGGLRVGESLGVMVEDVAFYDGYATISVWRQVHRDGRIDDPKTATGIRTALVLDPYASRLRELVETRPHDGGWLCANGIGDPMSRYALKRRWEKLMRSLPDGVEPTAMRNLRSSYETFMHWEKGMPLEVVSKLMGHRDTKVTLEHYDRPGEDAIIAKAVASLGA